MKISIIHPTRGRAQQAYATFSKWMLNAENTDRIEYILSVDSDDKSDYSKFPDDSYLWPEDFVFLRSDNKSAIEAINNAAKIATGDLFIVVSDDFDCFRSWDIMLIAAIYWDAENLFMYIDRRTDFIVKTKDGLQKTLITLPIMDRAYYSRFGYIYHPDYLHMHCDEEMTIVGHMLGKVITMDLLFPHNHYTTGKMEFDDINAKNNATWAHGQATLDRHALNNFGIENPLIKREDIVWK